MREEKELVQLSNGKPVSGGDLDKEKAKVLMLVYTPDKPNPNSVATGANLIDIEASFHEDTKNQTSDKTEDSADKSDESMNRLLHGRRK